MDYSLLAAAGSAISTARDIGKAALALRDFNAFAATISAINDQLLKAQDSLFGHNAQLQALQQENFGMANRLRELEEKLADRGRYTLVEISDRTFVLGVNTEVQLTASDPTHVAEPHHYICQPCFAKGIKSVLQKYNFCGAISLECPLCKERFDTGQSEPDARFQ